MKNYFITITLCLWGTIFCFGQDRVNRTKLSFINEGAVLNNITGWGYSELEGEWINCVDVIETDKKNVTYTTIPSFKSHRFNNIISLQFKTIICNDALYYVLIWDKWVGAYRYPSIMEDWEYWTSKIYLMFTEENIMQLKSLTNKPTSIKVLSFERGRYDTNTEDVDIIQTNMNRTYIDTDFVIIYKATNGSVRFLFKEYLHNKTPIEEIEKQYFEISELDYQKFIGINL